MSDSQSEAESEQGALALRKLRAATSGICDVIPLTTEDDFQFSSATIMTGNALLVDSSTTALEYDRTPAHIARAASTTITSPFA